ncbi:MAG: class I SAM-dependent methyltransferase [Candidatus Acidiferrales bacterium]
MPDRSRARELAAESNRKGDATGWFERLYQEAEAGKNTVPWADFVSNPHLVEFWASHPLDAAGKSALVIGSGLGDDSELLAAWGYQTTAFDISETAIRATRKRFPKSFVHYVAADLLAPPPLWRKKFDFVVEIYTLQVLPATLRPRAIEKIARFVRPGGHFVVIARGREESEPEGEMPWPLTRAELQSFTRLGLTQELFEEYADPDEPSVSRFRALYARPS